MSDNTMFASIADLQKLVRGASNSQSFAMLNTVMAETIGMSMHNAVSTQHNAQMLNSAATTSTCARILSVIGVKVAPAAATPVTTPPVPAPSAPVANNGDSSGSTGQPTTNQTDNTGSTSGSTGTNANS